MVFIGTGGGRFATIYQTRSTGGFILDDGVRMHIDPGPGALTNMSKAGIDPALTEAILISHCHPDHYSDGEVLIEGMTLGGIKKRGLIGGSESVMHGIDGIGPGISRYHQSMAQESTILKVGGSLSYRDLKVDFTPTLHTDPTGVGMVFHTSQGKISYVGDTHMKENVVQAHQGARVLLLSVTRPSKARVQCHLCTEDAIEFVEATQPEVAVLTHLGVRMIQAGPEKEADKIAAITGVRTVAARDLMEMTVGNEVSFREYS